MSDLNYQKPHPYLNPYLAGVLLGLTLLASFLILGAGLGASGGISRIAAFCESCIDLARVTASKYFGPYFQDGENPLKYYLVFMLLGVFLGGLFSAWTSKRCQIQLERGKSSGAFRRIFFALLGGIIVGFASRFGQGCTSGQALSGGALLLTGSLVFMGCVFAGGYVAAYFVRRQWHD